MSRRPLLLPAALLLCACGHRPAVTTEAGLPLRRVVIYRNGVGYFERAGRVEAPSVAFQVKPEHVGDFLATLAVMGEGGDAVRSAAFPLARGAATAQARETVTLALDGGAHQLAVGYVVEQPIWRPTYRVVVGEQGLELQSWGIVQNLSGEDWRDVQLSLVAGAPLAYRATLQTPVTPPRPTLDDRGEVFSAIALGESMLALAPSPSLGINPTIDQGSTSAGLNVGADFVRNIAVQRPAGRGGAARAFESLAAISQVSAVGGTARYDLPHPVSIPDASASMVLLSVRKVPGRAQLLFAPDPGVSDSARHPFRVARFTNDTPGLLERGPIAVFEAGAFLGQGVLEPVPEGAQATVPFSLERGLAVDSRVESLEQGARLAEVEGGLLTVERETTVRTTYRVHNGGAQAARVLVRHTRQQGTRLVQSPPDTEDAVGSGYALVPAQAPARSVAETAVDERTGSRSKVNWFGPEAELAVRGYLEDPRADAAERAALQKLWAVRELIVQQRAEQTRLAELKEAMAADVEQERDTLEVLLRSRDAELKSQTQRRLAAAQERHTRATELLLRVERTLEVKESELQEQLRTLRVRGLPHAG